MDGGESCGGQAAEEGGVKLLGRGREVESWEGVVLWRDEGAMEGKKCGWKAALDEWESWRVEENLGREGEIWGYQCIWIPVFYPGLITHQ